MVICVSHLLDNKCQLKLEKLAVGFNIRKSSHHQTGSPTIRDRDVSGVGISHSVTLDRFRKLHLMSDAERISRGLPSGYKR